MIEQMAPPSDGGLSPALPLQFQAAHDVARSRFREDPTKCYQRHIRDVWGEAENRFQLTSLANARVERISKKEAESVILKYEWLQTMGRGVSACYGLKLDGELLGANCFGVMGGKIGDICGPEYAKQTVCLMRGACAPHAPKNAGSFLTRWACRQAYRDFGWQIFFAYSDAEAGEIGTIYQACGWYYVGSDLGRPSGSFHVDYQSPDGMIITSYKLNHQGTEKKFMRSLGWTPENAEMRPWLVAHGWKPIRRYGKKKWVWFEGSNKEKLKQVCRYKFLPYPKRSESVQ